MGFQTDCITTGEDRERFQGSVPPPIFESSLFTFPTYESFAHSVQGMEDPDVRRPVYTRGINPTVRVLERKIALLEHGEDARAFSSGMAAISAAVLSAAKAGNHIIAVQGIYNTAYRLLREYLPQLGIETTFLRYADVKTLQGAIRPTTRCLYLESPGNPMMDIVDIASVAGLAKDRGLVTILDNSMATPYNQRPLDLGIDLVVHSATKYFSGHSDVVAGAVVGNTDLMTSIGAHELHDLGGIIGPFEAWLVLRGLRTLGLRMTRHNTSAQLIASWLETCPEVERVFYAGLPSHPQHDLAVRQMGGFSGVLSVSLKGGLESAVQFVDHLRLFGIGVSWGGFESLALPMQRSVAMHPELSDALEIASGLVRLSIGLEDVEDLVEDIEQALQHVTSTRGSIRSSPLTSTEQ